MTENPARSGRWVRCKCAVCRKPFYRLKVDVARRKTLYCSQACYRQHPRTDAKLLTRILRHWRAGFTFFEIGDELEISSTWAAKLFKRLTLTAADLKERERSLAMDKLDRRSQRQAMVLPYIRAGLSHRQTATRLGLSLTALENALAGADVPRSVNGRQLRRYCKRGHDLWADNARYTTKSGRTTCRLCQSERSRDRYATNKRDPQWAARRKARREAQQHG